MAELPDQLEDLIGELIEEEEDLGVDLEDVSSAWADSLDQGAGFGQRSRQATQLLEFLGVDSLEDGFQFLRVVPHRREKGGRRKG